MRATFLRPAEALAVAERFPAAAGLPATALEGLAALAGLTALAAGFFAAATLGLFVLLGERMFFVVMGAYWTMNQLFTSSCLL